MNRTALPPSPLLQSRRSVIGLLLGSMLVGAAMVATPALAQNEHKHEHASAPAASARTTAPAKKFVTDDALRKGMASIASIVAKPAKEIQEASLKGPAYLEMARQVEGQVADIIKNCKLEPKADHTLHEIIFDVNQSIGLMRRNSVEIQRTGVLALNQALRNYAKYFDHPGWTGPQ